MPSRRYELQSAGLGVQPQPTSPSGSPAAQQEARRSVASLSDIVPFGAPPIAERDLAGAVASGRPAMWCDEPELDTGLAAFGLLRVAGWAYSRRGIEVLVFLDGQRHEPRLGLIREDLAGTFGEEMRESGFSVLIDLDAHRSGRLELVVAARTPDGVTVGVRGKVECRPTPEGVRPPEWQPAAAPGDPDVPNAGSGSGERFVPEGWHGRLIAIEHESRYRWAEGLARDRDVLDVACGVGYGTSVLARAGARRILGLDVSDDAIDRARERAGHLAEFLVGDLHNLPCEDGSFDLVTCFETIEHVADPDRALDELRRVLRPGGLLLLSSPNRDVYVSGNPFHLHEYTPEELEDALSGRFAHVTVYRQQSHLTSLICDDETFAVEHLDQRIDTDIRKGVASVAGEELYMVAAASDAPLPNLPSIGVLGEVFDVKIWYERALAWEERALVAEARAQAHEATGRAAVFELERILALRASSLRWWLTQQLRRTRRGVRSAKRFASSPSGRLRRAAAAGRARLRGGHVRRD